LETLASYGMEIPALAYAQERIDNMTDKRPAIAVCHMWWVLRRRWVDGALAVVMISVCLVLGAPLSTAQRT